MEFKKELEILINRCSMENGSDTPDFILAQYLDDCLKAYNRSVKRRDRWYGHKPFQNQIKFAPDTSFKKEMGI